jgi:hypothetical protein
MAKNTNAGAGIDPSLLAEGPEAVDARDTELADLRETVRQLLAQNRALVDDRKEDPGSASERGAASKERFGIIIDEGHDQNDITEVPVQVNGRAYQIKRGQYVEVPREVVSVLKDAVIDKSIAQFDATGMPNGIKVRPSRRFPFQEFGLVINADGERVREPQPQLV